jgi:hypothetical protein
MDILVKSVQNSIKYMKRHERLEDENFQGMFVLLMVFSCAQF